MHCQRKGNIYTGCPSANYDLAISQLRAEGSVFSLRKAPHVATHSGVDHSSHSIAVWCMLCLYVNPSPYKCAQADSIISTVLFYTVKQRFSQWSSRSHTYRKATKELLLQRGYFTAVLIVSTTTWVRPHLIDFKCPLYRRALANTESQVHSSKSCDKWIEILQYNDRCLKY